MGGELDPIVGLYHAIVFILTSDWMALEPFVKRVLTIAFYIYGMIFIWKWLKKK